MTDSARHRRNLLSRIPLCTAKEAKMSPVELLPMGKIANCAINQDGTISLPQRVIDALGWRLGVEVASCHTPVPLTLMLPVARDGRPGYKLSSLSRNGLACSGGKLNCRAFAKHMLRPRIPLPQRNIP